MRWIIYGANGYTAQLIAREAVMRGHRPVLAARSFEKIDALARELQLTTRTVSLANPEVLEAALSDMDAVVHCAGPFSVTCAQMIEACIRTGTHYFDLTGEIDALQYAHSKNINQRAIDAGIIICPGIGFDVIPTDCLALTLARAMPHAVELSLGFDSSGSISPGTAKTSIEAIARGGKTRMDGQLVNCRLAHKTRSINFWRR